MFAKKALAATAAGAEPIFIEDTFSTYLYTGNGSTQTITNGIDLSGEGGMVWIKGRSNAEEHALFDTNRGAGYYIQTQSTAGQASESGFSSFGSSGFSLAANVSVGINNNTRTYASWTFRKAEKFFDVVTYTGNGSNRTISHNLGSIPGCIIVKRTDTTGAWQVYHRSLANTEYMVLNTAAAKATGTTRWNSTTPTSTVFSLGTDATVNASGGTYVAYLFAHDAGGFGENEDQSVIKCGGYTGNGSSVLVDLGWEPQWLLIRESSGAANWHIFDNMRGVTTGGNDTFLYANTTAADNTGNDYLSFNATGFTPDGADNAFRQSGVSYIYIAIRRGPMKTPEVGTEVFAVETGNSSGAPEFNAGFPIDMALIKNAPGVEDWYNSSRLLQNTYLIPNSSSAESSSTFFNFAYQNGWWAGSTTRTSWMFRRAPGFFDVVCYTGTGTARTVTHNLGVAPELMIVKRRNDASSWYVWGGNMPMTNTMFLEQDSASGDNSAYFNDTAPTSSVFSVNTFANTSSATYVAYLFASVTGVSKVGSYTGNGSNQTINCGFTAGARFIMIKRTDNSGDWKVIDTARGIVSGNDPTLALNSTAAEVTGTDCIDPDNSGFIVNQESTNNLNVNSATYIYLAIA